MTKMDAARNRRAAKYGLASLTLASAMTFAGFYREPGPFVRCEELVKEVVNFPSKLTRSIESLPERMNPTWAENHY